MSGTKIDEPTPPDIALEMKAVANKIYSKKDFSGAAAKYSAILDQFSESISPLFIRVVRCNRAACLIELGRYQDAVPDLQEVIRVEDSSREGQAVTYKGHFRLARCFCELGKYGDAVQHIEKYRELIGGQPKLEETSLYTKILSGLIPRDQIPDRNIPQPPSNARSTVVPRPAGPIGNNLRQVRYEIRVFNVETPIVKFDLVPVTLCSLHPPEVQTKMFLASLIKKYHNELLKSRKWHCWNCPAKAVGLVHTPASYLHLPDAQVIDFTQPVCVNGGLCENAARAMMGEEMRSVAARGEAI